MDPSPKYTLNKQDLLKILRGAVIATGGALATYVTTAVIPNLDQNTMLGALVAGVASIVLNVARKYMAGETKPG